MIDRLKVAAEKKEVSDEAPVWVSFCLMLVPLLMPSDSRWHGNRSTVYKKHTSALSLSDKAVVKYVYYEAN